ncbi:alpha/beta hydrolase [Streptomyces sp. NBC_01754]|uniref:alpha/beta hydrolase n=1 Tax=Streptomyces sp. NBC_01754 TaxID=2975930 RepID=UPI002DD91C38|nr:alpha/beta hydrolase [Streptomyces sp. NBC_01754]WSC95040.1 alpha/beta hydrolase [Streptomyces sp. NBC_01754]
MTSTPTGVPVMSRSDRVELEELLTALSADDWPADIDEARVFYDSWGTPIADDIVVEVRDGGYLLTPPDVEGSRTGLFLHGGGYVYGSLRSHGAMVSEIGRAARCRMFFVDYRRAPEHPYPAALDDAVAAHRSLLAEGVAPCDVVFAGDSAGGGLVLATLLRLRDEGLPLPAAAACVSPWTDLAGTGESHHALADEDPMLSEDVVALVTGSYLAGTAPTVPYASPLYGDLAGLPPVLVQVGSREVLLSDAERFVAGLRRAGSTGVLEVWPGMVHVWHLHHARLAKAREAVTRLGDWLRSQAAGAR